MNRVVGAICCAALCGVGQGAAAGPRIDVPAPVYDTSARYLSETILGLDERDIRDLLPPVPRERQGRVSVMIVGKKTSALRSTDTLPQLRKYGHYSVASAQAHRDAEDAYFTTRARALAARLEESDGFALPADVIAVTTGEQFIAALVATSRLGPITNVGLFGHKAATALYMLEDRGFYTSVAAVAKVSPLVSGTDAEKEAKLREMGARDLSDLEALIKSGTIRFAKGAVMMFTGCSAGGTKSIEPQGIAARFAELTGATTIASVDVSDQSMLYGRRVLELEASRGVWVKFAPHTAPEKLNTRIIDAMKYLNLAVDAAAAERVDTPSAAEDKYHCAVADALGLPGRTALCGAARGDIAELLRW